MLHAGALGFVGGALIALLLHAFGRHRLAIVVVLAVVAALAAYKFVAAPDL